MKKLSYWSLIVGCLFSLSEKATGQQMLTLEESVRIALAQDVSRQISDQQVRIATNNHHGSIAGKYPFVAFNLNSQGSLANQDNPASFLNGLIRSGNAVFSLDASWVVFEGFRARYNLDRLEKLEGQALNQLRTTSLETVRRVSLAYLFADWQQAQVKLAQEVLQLSNDLYNYQEQRREFGQALRQHLLQSRDAVLTDSSNLLLSQFNLRTALISLRLAMGQPDRAPFCCRGRPGGPTRIFARGDDDVQDDRTKSRPARSTHQ
jgi:outer membrane protein